MPTALALGLRLARMGGPQQDYYRATVVSMLRSAHNLLYGSFDSVGLVMVDKPPLAFWVQAPFVAMLGPANWAVALPQALLGAGAVALLYRIVADGAGRIAGLVGALVLAALPAAVWVGARNETDGLLAFLALLAAGAAIRAARTGRAGWAAVVGALLGAGFMTKMAMALIPAPALLAYYLAASPLPLRTRLARVVLAGAVFLVTALWWPTLVALTPPASRPFVDSTSDNSVFTLIVGENGLDRFVRPFARPPDGPTAIARPPPLLPVANAEPGFEPQALALLFVMPRLSGFIGWLLPAGLVLLAVSAVPFARARPGQRAEMSLWGGWLLTAVLVLGLARATASHPYYLAALAAPLAATVGIGVGGLAAQARTGGRGAAAGLAGLLLGTVAYAVASVAFLPRGGPVPGQLRSAPEVVRAVERYLAAHREPGAALDLVAMRSASVEPFLIAGFTAAALGGFDGAAPATTSADLDRLAAHGQVTYFLSERGGRGLPNGPVGPPGRTPRGRIEEQVRASWPDVSTEAGLPAGTLYRRPGASPN